MSNADPGGQDAFLPSSWSAEIDAICDRFEAARRAGQAPQIEEYLKAVPGAGIGDLFQELLWVELAWRRRNQETPTPNEYRRRFPQFSKEVEAAFASGLASPAADSGKTGSDSTIDQPRALHVHCPHCHNPIEIVDDLLASGSKRRLSRAILTRSIGCGYHLTERRSPPSLRKEMA